jgi:hypothetical protein
LGRINSIFAGGLGQPASFCQACWGGYDHTFCFFLRWLRHREPGTAGDPAAFLAVYLLLGAAFGFVFSRSEVISGFRIQEMFRFQSFRMYGIIGSAVVTAAISIVQLKRPGLTSASGERISIPRRPLGSGIRYAAGGAIFGLGWALTGACPGPLFALVGNGVSVLVVAVVSALAGTWVYGWAKPRQAASAIPGMPLASK